MPFPRALRTALLAAAAVLVAPAAEPLPDEPRAAGREIIARARRAASGAGVLRDYSFDLATEVARGEQWARMESRVQILPPDLFRQEIQTASGRLTLVVAAGEGWREIGGARQPLPSDAVERQQAELARALLLFNPPAEPLDARLRGEETLDAEPVYVVDLADVGGVPLRVFLHRMSLTIVKTEHVGEIPGGGLARIEEYFSDFVAVEGFRIPLRRRVVRNGVEALRSVKSSPRVNTGLTRETLPR